ARRRNRLDHLVRRTQVRLPGGLDHLTACDRRAIGDGMFGFPLLAASFILGLFAAVAARCLAQRAFRDIDQPLQGAGLGSAIAAGLLSAALAGAMLSWGCQETPDVVPTPFWRDARAVYQAMLIVLIVVATATDLRAFYITDSVTVTGMFLGGVGATIAGDLQMAHVWVDWNQEIPQLSGPYRPEWLSAHPHLHGLAWSVTGLVVGAALTWLVRTVSAWMLGQEALGFGDVMLMGMIGSFLGWQPTLVAFLLAPLAALSVGLLVKLLGKGSYIPYGPYLGLAALMVMFSWRWIWMFEWGLHAGASTTNRLATFAVRRLFGDWLSLAVVAAATVLGLVALLGLSRLYRLIPVDRTRSGRGDAPSHSTESLR
ncbi:MAG: prepilin peptidase, partial [Planctomycetaceae bacterium]|nr:prepilin peptidase [Planctomycetaceae bacterium]